MSYSSPGPNYCAKLKYEGLDKKLNVTYQALLKELDPSNQKSIKTAELAWIKYRDLHCQIVSDKYKNDPFFELQKFNCLSFLTQQRIQVLQAFRDSLKATNSIQPEEASVVMERYPANIEPINISNDLLRLNPHYKERAASAYEVANLGKAAGQLFVYCKMDIEKQPLAIEILRAFIYDWADFYVRNNGPRDDKLFIPIKKTMDERFEKLLSSEQFKLYKEWCNFSRDKNDLEFLTHIEE